MKEKIKGFVKNHKKEIALITISSVVSVVVFKKISSPSGPLIKDIASEGFAVKEDGRKVMWVVFDKNDNALHTWEADPEETLEWIRRSEDAIKEFIG